tara:strand:- start:579 stop:1541 length:963 start_codon:yes stop_codon:yes gene_type:complete
MKTKFAIGCLVQWYECDIIEEYIDSLKDAIDVYDGEVIVDFHISKNQDLEKCISDEQFQKCVDKILSKFDNVYNYISTVNGIDETNLVTIADYRREFNSRYCEHADVLVWGETDMLVPKQMFTVLDMLHQNSQTPKYIATFGICKMWDDSWRPLEHIDFTDKPFVHGDGENWWQLRYTMNKDEMNTFNNKVEDLTITNISPHKYNGCGLVISSEVIKSGVNIPKSCFFIKEDTAFMLMTQKILGNIPQYHFKNILLVHNRKHPKKRMHIKDENNLEYIDDKRTFNSWYTKANKMCEENNRNLFNPNYKSYTWKNVWGNIK